MNRLSSGLALCAVFSFACGATSSSGGSGSITGTATLTGETDNSPIVVTLSGPTGQATKAATDGSYTFRNLAPGSYAVIASAPSTAEGSVLGSVVVAAGNSAAPALALTPLGSLTGKATLGAATGNAGIVVVASMTSAVAVTDDAGNYTLSGVATGSYDVVASLSGQGSAHVSGVTVKYAQTVTVAAMTLSGPTVAAGSISGTVSLGAAGAVGIAVSLLGPVPSAAITDSTGKYQFSNLPDGTYTVSAAAVSTVEGSQSVSVVVAQGQAAAAPAISFSPLGQLSGIATLSPAPSGSAGILVVVLGTSAIGVTDASGNWKVRAVPVGNQQVLFSAPGYTSQTVSVQAAYAQTVAMPAVTLLKTTAQGSLAGTVQLAGLAQADLTGVAALTLSGPVSGAALTAADGSFSFTGLPDGSYAVTATAHSTAEGELTSYVAVANGSGPAVNFSFTPVGTVTGIATVDGHGSGGIVVVAAGTSVSTSTGPDGSFTLAGVPSGAQTIVATQPSLGLSGSTAITVPFDGALSLSSPLALTGSLYAGGVSGTVALAGLSPTPDLTGVVALTLTGPVSQVAVTAADGSFSFGNLPDGAYSVSAAAPSTVELSESTPVVVANGASTPLQFSFSPLGTVAGIATAGDSGAGIVVVVAGADVSANTNADGSFKLAGVPSGLQTIVASQAGLGLTATATVMVPYDGIGQAGTLQLGSSIYTGALSGTVRMLGLASQPNLANVVAVTLSGPISAAALTNASGAFSFADLPDGTYAVTALAPSTAEGDLTVGNVVVAGGAAAPVAFSFSPLGNITGTVDIDSVPSSGVFVAAAGTTSSATTGAAGTYTLRGIPAGAGATIIATQASSGLSGGTTVASVGYASTVTATLIALQSHTVPSTGQVSVAITGIAAADFARVTLTLSGPVSAAAVPTSSPYAFSGLPSGTYAVTASMPSTLEVSQGAAANVTQSGSQSLSFNFTELGNVSGAVTVNGAPVAGVFVTAAGTNASATTSSSGGYTLRGVPTGATTVIATQLTTGYSGSTSVTTSYNATASAAAIALSSPAVATGQVSVSLSGVAAADLPHVTLTLSGPVSAAAVPTASTYNFSNLPNGTYAVTASMPSTLELSQAATASVAGSSQPVSFAFTEVGSVTGSVTVNGAGAAGVFVAAAGTGSSATTSAAGTYTLRGVPAGAAANIIATQLTSELSGSASIASVAYNTSTAVAAIALTSPAASTGQISVALAGMSVADLAHVTLTLVGPVSAAAVPAATPFVFSGLPNGTYSVLANMPSTLELSQAATAVVTQGTTQHPSFTFTEVGVVTGSVTVNGSPVAGVFVTAAGSTASATTGVAGTYTLRGVPTGATTVIATQLTTGYSNSTTVTTVYNTSTAATAIPLTSPAASTGQVTVTLTGVAAADLSHVTLTLTGPVSIAAVPSASTFTFNALPSGLYSVSATMPSTLELSQATTVTVAQGAATPAGFTFTEVGSVSGSVTVNGSAASGVFVTAVGTSASASTNASGVYTLRGVPTGAATLIASQLSTDATGSTTTTISYNATASATTIPLTVPTSTGSVAVTVSGVPAGDLSHVTLTLTGPGSAAAQASAATTTFSGLLPGTYSVTANVPSTLELSQAAAVVVSTGAAAVSFTFTELGSVSGSVTVNGSAASGVLVTAVGTSASATTNTSGAYTLRGVPTGAANLIATQLTTNASGSTTATIAYNSTASAATIALTTPGAAGIVAVTLSGVPLADVSHVTLTLTGPTSMAALASGLTTNLGGLLSGTYSVTANMPSTQEISQSAVITVGQGTTSVTLTFTEVGSVSGSVTVNGSAASGVFVTAVGTSASASTNASGVYTLRGVPTGAATLIASQLSTDATGSTTTTIAYNSTASAATIPLTVPTSTGSVAVTVSGVPAGDLSHVTLTLTGPGSAAAQASAATTTFSGLVPGTYSVTANVPSTLELSQAAAVVVSTGAAAVSFTFTEVGTVTGTVTVSGTATAGVFVAASGTNSTATTNTSGVFTLRNVPTGAANIVATQLTSELSASTAVASVAYNAVTSAGTIALAPTTAPGSVKVSIAGMTGADLSNVTVSLIGAVSQAGTPATSGVNAGTITFTGVAAGMYSVNASAASTVEISQSSVITVAAAQVPVPFTFTEVGSISGTITLNSVGFGGASVVATASGLATTSISPGGSYVLHNVPVGSVALVANGGGSYGAATATVTYKGSATQNIALGTVQASGSISGTVLVKGQPTLGIGGVTVTLAGPIGGGTTTSGSAGAIATSGSTGLYSFTNLPDGKYAITATAPATSELSATIINATISGGAALTAQNFSFTPDGAFTGTITAGGKALPGALVYADGVVNTVVTNGAGQFRLAGLPSFGGAYTVHAAAQSYTTAAFSPTSLNTSTYTTDTALGTLDLGAPVAGGTGVIASTVSLIGLPAGEGILVSLCVAGSATANGPCTLASIPSGDPNPVLASSWGGYTFTGLTGSTYDLHFGSTANGTSEDGSYIENIPVFTLAGTSGFVNDLGTAYPLAALEVQRGVRIIHSTGSTGEQISSDSSRLLALMNPLCFFRFGNGRHRLGKSTDAENGNGGCSGALYQMDAGGDPLQLSTSTSAYAFVPTPGAGSNSVVYEDTPAGGALALKLLPQGTTTPVTLLSNANTDSFYDATLSSLNGDASPWLMVTDLNYLPYVAQILSPGTISQLYGAPVQGFSFSPDKADAYLQLTSNNTTIATALAGCPASGTCGSCETGGTCVSLGVLDYLTPQVFASDGSMTAFRNAPGSSQCLAFLEGDNPTANGTEYCWNTAPLFTAHENGNGFPNTATPNQLDAAAYDGQTEPWQLIDPGSTVTGASQRELVWEAIATPTQGNSRVLKTEAGDISGGVHVLQTLVPGYATYTTNYDVEDWHVINTVTGGTSTAGYAVVWESAVGNSSNCAIGACTYTREIFSSSLSGTNVLRLDSGGGVVAGSLQVFTATNASSGAAQAMAIWIQVNGSTQTVRSATISPTVTTPTLTTISSSTDGTSSLQVSPSGKYVLYRRAETGSMLYEAQLIPARTTQLINSNSGTVQFPELSRNIPALVDKIILEGGFGFGLSFVDLSSPASPNPGVVIDGTHTVTDTQPLQISPVDASGPPRVLYQTSSTVNVGYLSTSAPTGNQTVMNTLNQVNYKQWAPNGAYAGVQIDDVDAGSPQYEVWSALAPTTGTFNYAATSLAVLTNPECGGSAGPVCFYSGAPANTWVYFDFTPDSQIAYAPSLDSGELIDVYLAKLAANGSISNTNGSLFLGAEQGQLLGRDVDPYSIALTPDGSSIIFLSAYDPDTTYSGTLQYAKLANDTVITLGSQVGYNLGGSVFVVSPASDRLLYSVGVVDDTITTPPEMFEVKLDGNTSPVPLALLHDVDHALWLNDTTLFGQRIESPIPYRLQDGYYFAKVP